MKYVRCGKIPVFYSPISNTLRIAVRRSRRAETKSGSISRCSERQRNFSRRQFAGSSSIGAEAFSQHRSVRVGEADLTFTAAFATPDGRHQLRLIDIHIDKRRIDGRPMIQPRGARRRNTSRQISRFALKYPRAGYRRPHHPRRHLRRRRCGFTFAKINSRPRTAGNCGEIGQFDAPVSIRAASSARQ